MARASMARTKKDRLYRVSRSKNHTVDLPERGGFERVDLKAAALLLSASSALLRTDTARGPSAASFAFAPPCSNPPPAAI